MAFTHEAGLARGLLPGERVQPKLAAIATALFAFACQGPSGPRFECDADAQRVPARAVLGCYPEFAAQAARPLDSALPGALTVKTLIDRADDLAVYFTDTEAYPFHQGFAADQLGWIDPNFFLQYLTPDRRFLLGSITHYEEPDIWAYELAPYDTADVDMIAASFRALREATYFGGELAFHPVSAEQSARAAELPDDIARVSTDEIYRGISYQPLNLGETYAQVRILTAADLDTTYVSPRELVVLDRAPNDISVVAGVITEEFQTPLSHVNVLSQQRGTPNMGLRNARAELAEFAGRWVRLQVGAFDYAITAVTVDEAEAWWADHGPTPIEVTAPDYSVQELLDIDAVSLADLAAVGGKAAHFGELRAIEEVVTRPAFVIPVFFYRQFLEQNQFDAMIGEMLADPEFRADGNLRKARLESLRAAMLQAPIDPTLLAALDARIAADFANARMRFRSSTNAEDLQGFSGAGLYDSHSGDPNDATRPVADAVRAVWASLWNFRAFEERAYVSIDHTQVAMAILVHPTYVDERANGVAITANLFDPGAGGEDAFYINAQVGEISVVQPPGSRVVADQLMYYHFHVGQPATYYAHSSELPPGQTVLDRAQLFDLGNQLRAVRDHFAARYQPPPAFGRLPMDVEFKLVGDAIELKQARPYPGRGTEQ